MRSSNLPRIFTIFLAEILPNSLSDLPINFKPSSRSLASSELRIRPQLETLLRMWLNDGPTAPKTAPNRPFDWEGLTIALPGIRGRVGAVGCILGLAAGVLVVTGETLFELSPGGSDDGPGNNNNRVCVASGAETLLSKECSWVRWLGCSVKVLFSCSTYQIE